MSEGGSIAVSSDESVVGTSEVKRLEKKMRELERLLGRKTMEVEILREALDKANSKKRTLPFAQGRRPMKTIADTLKVSRSNLHERKNATKPRKPHYACVGDAEAVEAIRPFVDKKPSFGYRRIAGILNKQRRLEGKPTINHKRVYRIMAMNG
jgi:hypothetical protein